jgi:hypothetical protein
VSLGWKSVGETKLTLVRDGYMIEHRG